MLKFTLFWFRRDLRLTDNVGLKNALKDGANVLPIFIFDSAILDQLKNPRDRRVTFIYSQLKKIKSQLNGLGSDLHVFFGEPVEVFKSILKEHSISQVYTNHDYEPYGRERDRAVSDFLQSQGIQLNTFKDQCVFEKKEILTDQKSIYSVYTPYKKKWLATVKPEHYSDQNTENYFGNLAAIKKITTMVTLKELGFEFVDFDEPDLAVSESILKNYAQKRDFPAEPQGTSRLGLHLRFGTISVRHCVRVAIEKSSDVWLSELIWRDFFMQILWNFPIVVRRSFKPQYENIAWRNKKSEFDLWSTGQTGYPLVDAGMRELNQTGHMHNRVRMVVASFLTKHLLTHWYLGERYFAAHLLDYDLAANNGNWQWAAGTGCDAAPYFRVFNPETQLEKFDPEYKYVKKWVPEWNTGKYPKPMVEHAFARERALETYKQGLNAELKLDSKPATRKSKGKT